MALEKTSKIKKNYNRSNLALLTTLTYPYEAIFIENTLAEAGIKTLVEKCNCNTDNAFFAGYTPLTRVFVSLKNFRKASSILNRVTCFKHFGVDTSHDPDIKTPVIVTKEDNKKICIWCFCIWLLMFGSAMAFLLNSISIY